MQKNRTPLKNKTRPVLLLMNLIIFSLILLLPSYSKPFKSAPSKEGLIVKTANYPSDNIICLAASRDALWTGTTHGCSRYDGITWKIFQGSLLVPDSSSIFKSIPGNVPELKKNEINGFSILNDNIWMASDSGLLRFSTSSGRWIAFTKENSPVPTNYIQSVFAFDNTVIVGTWGKGLLIYKTNTSAFNLDQGTDFKGEYITSIAGDSRRILVGTLKNGLNIFNITQKKWKNISCNSGIIPSQKITAITSGEDKYYIGTDKGLLILDAGKGKNHLFTKVNSNIAGDSIKALQFHKERGLLYAGTTKGLSVFNGVSWQTFTTYHGLPENWITSIAVWNNRLWVGTYCKGLAFMELKK
jgi:ligand-binding sensor domain-containing protein